MSVSPSESKSPLFNHRCTPMWHQDLFRARRPAVEDCKDPSLSKHLELLVKASRKKCRKLLFVFKLIINFWLQKKGVGKRCCLQWKLCSSDRHTFWNEGHRKVITDHRWQRTQKIMISVDKDYSGLSKIIIGLSNNFQNCLNNCRHASLATWQHALWVLKWFCMFSRSEKTDFVSLLRIFL